MRGASFCSLNEGGGATRGCTSNEFCGRDGACHAIGDCEILYRYALPSVTGQYESLQGDDAYTQNMLSTMVAKNKANLNGGPYNISQELLCTTEYQTDHIETVEAEHSAGIPFFCKDDKDDPVWPLALEYRCMRRGIYYGIPEAGCPRQELDNRYVSFTRMCTALPNTHQSFTCFDMNSDATAASDVSTSSLTTTTSVAAAAAMADYQATIASNPNCTVENLDRREAEMTNLTNCAPLEPWNATCLEARQEYADSVTNNTHDFRMIRYFMNEAKVEYLNKAMVSVLLGTLPKITDDDGNSPASSGSVTTAAWNWRDNHFSSVHVTVMMMGLALGLYPFLVGL